MFLKILDVHDEVTDDVEFGTCELCFSTGTLYQKFIEVEYDGEVFDVEMGGWSWGDYIEDMVPRINNIIKFNDFVMTQPVILEKNGYKNTYDIDDIHSVLVSLMEYYDVFHQQDELRGDELLNERLMHGVKNGSLSLDNYHNQDGGLQKIMTFLHNYEYYELNWFIYEFVNVGWEYGHTDSEGDQEWQYEEMMKYIDKYESLLGVV